MLKEKIRFLVVPESLMMLLEPMLTWMVSCLKETLKVQTAFLELFRLSLGACGFYLQLLLLELVCCGCLVEDTLLIVVVASLPAAQMLSA